MDGRFVFLVIEKDIKGRLVFKRFCLMFKTVLNWLVKSSKDPAKIALTIKGAGATLVSVLAVFGLGLSLDDVNGFADSLASVAANGVALVSAGVTLWGFGRKIVLSLKK